MFVYIEHGLLYPSEADFMEPTPQGAPASATKRHSVNLQW